MSNGRLTDKFWSELKSATTLVANGGVRRADGNGFKVYVIPASGIVRIDIDQPSKEGTQ